MGKKVFGAWTGFSFSLSKTATKVFNKAVKGIVGVGYTPLAVATQVVAGKNYCYLCKGVVVYPGSPEFAAKLYVYAPLEGPPHITEIERIEP